MSLKQLEQRLRQDTQQELDSILSSARQQADEIKKQNQKEADEQAAKIIQNTEKTAELTNKKTVGEALRRQRQELAAEKDRQFAGILEKARQNILAAPPAKKKKILQRLCEDTRLIGGKLTITADPKYAKLIGKQKNAKVKQEKIGDFGVVITSDDGLVRVDNRLTTILESSKQRLKSKVNEILHGK